MKDPMTNALRQFDCAVDAVRWVRNFSFQMSVTCAARGFRREAALAHSIDDVLDLAFRFRRGSVSIRPAQIREELRGFLLLAAETRPKRIVEIGTANGGTLFLLAAVAPADARIISVDLPGGPFGGGYSPAAERLFPQFTHGQQQLQLVAADSHASATAASVASFVDDLPFDVVFIDGDHSYEGVATDFEMYGKQVRSGGLVAIHDIVPGPRHRVGGVPSFWRHIRKKYRTLELVADWSQGGYGIGVCFL